MLRSYKNKLRAITTTKPILSAVAITLGVGALLWYARERGFQSQLLRLAQEQAATTTTDTSPLRVARIGGNANNNAAQPEGPRPLFGMPEPDPEEALQFELPNPDVIGDDEEVGDAIRETESFDGTSERLRTGELVRELVEREKQAPFQPAIIDPDQQRLQVHHHDDQDEYALSQWIVLPRFERDGVFNASMQIPVYRVSYNLRKLTVHGDILRDLIITNLPHKAELHTLTLRLGNNATVIYNLGTLPSRSPNGIHIGIGDSPVMLFKMTGDAILTFTYRSEPQHMPTVFADLGLLKPNIKSGLEGQPLLALPFDAVKRSYLLYKQYPRQNVDLITLK